MKIEHFQARRDVGLRFPASRDATTSDDARCRVALMMTFSQHTPHEHPRADNTQSMTPDVVRFAAITRADSHFSALMPRLMTYVISVDLIILMTIDDRIGKLYAPSTRFRFATIQARSMAQVAMRGWQFL